MGPEGWHDAVAAGEALLAASDAPWLAARGASMGGCFLLLAARAHPRLFRALVLLCPADGPSLLAGLDDLERLERRGDPCRACFSRTPGTTRPCRSRTASAWRPCSPTRRDSSLWMRAATTAPGARCAR